MKNGKSTTSVLIVGLLIIILAVNWMWWQRFKTQDITNHSDAAALVELQDEVNQLKACIDEGAKPCNVTTSETEHQPETDQ